MSEIYNHVLYHKPIEGEAVSYEEYRKQGKNINTLTFDDSVFIYLPRDIELAKVST